MEQDKTKPERPGVDPAFVRKFAVEQAIKVSSNDPDPEQVVKLAKALTDFLLGESQ